MLATRGARVILACRDSARAATAADRIRGVAPGAEMTAVRLDLASLASVRAAAAQLRASCDRIDLLVNNAGVMMPRYGRTTDGFELQLGINHLGHFALTGLLLDRIAAVPGARCRCCAPPPMPPRLVAIATDRTAGTRNGASPVWSRPVRSPATAALRAGCWRESERVTEVSYAI